MISINGSEGVITMAQLASISQTFRVRSLERSLNLSKEAGHGPNNHYNNLPGSTSTFAHPILRPVSALNACLSTSVINSRGPSICHPSLLLPAPFAAVGDDPASIAFQSSP